MKSKKRILKNLKFCYADGVIRFLRHTLLTMLFFCGVSALWGNTELSSFVSCGVYDTATITQDGSLMNTNRNDSKYSTTLDVSSMQSPHLSIDVEVALIKSNAVWFGFGNSAIFPEFLRIGCEEGKWTVLMGDQVRAFDEELPPLLEGDTPRTFRLSILTSIDGNYSSSIKIYEEGNLQPTTLHINPALWQNIGGDPSTWDTATVNLQGFETIVNFIQCKTVRFATKIFIR